MGRYDEVLSLCVLGRAFCIECGRAREIPLFMTFHGKSLIEQGKKREARPILQQAYYASLALGNQINAETIKSYLSEIFEEEWEEESASGDLRDFEDEKTEESCNKIKHPSDLTDGQWEMIKRFFNRGNYGNRSKHNKRELVNAALYLTKTGTPWRMLPKEFPPFSTVHTFYRRCRLQGIWEKVIRELEKNGGAYS